MDEPSVAQLLIQAARQDVLACKALIAAAGIQDASIGFHAQQAIEKLMKAVLSRRNVRYRRAAGLADRVLRGAKLADLQFEQPTRFDVVLNLKTARKLNIKIPQSVSVRATRLIE